MESECAQVISEPFPDSNFGAQPKAAYDDEYNNLDATTIRENYTKRIGVKR